MFSRERVSSVEVCLKMRVPFVYFGGKSSLVNRLSFLLDKAGGNVYVETCCGGAHLFWNKNRRFSVEVLNDKDDNIMSVYECLKDYDLYRRLKRKLLFTFYSCSEFDKGCSVFVNNEEDVLRKAWGVMVVYNQCLSGKPYEISGKFRTGWIRNHKGSGFFGKWFLRMCSFRSWHERLKGVVLENLDVFQLIDKWDSSDTVFYVDPPYPNHTRVSGGYRINMTEEDHTKLVDKLLSVKGKVIVSSYKNPIYDRLSEEGGWNKFEVRIPCNASKVILGSSSGNDRRSFRREFLWCNFDVI